MKTANISSPNILASGLISAISHVPAEILLRSNPDFCGWLRKVNKDGKAQRRYCVLIGGKFYYFKDESSKKPQGVFSLQGYRAYKVVDSGYSTTFVLKYYKPGNRSYLFIASSEREQEDWVKHINDVISQRYPDTFNTEHIDEPDYDYIDLPITFSFTDDDNYVRIRSIRKIKATFTGPVVQRHNSERKPKLPERNLIVNSSDIKSKSLPKNYYSDKLINNNTQKKLEDTPLTRYVPTPIKERELPAIPSDEPTYASIKNELIKPKLPIKPTKPKLQERVVNEISVEEDVYISITREDSTTNCGECEHNSCHHYDYDDDDNDDDGEDDDGEDYYLTFDGDNKMMNEQDSIYEPMNAPTDSAGQLMNASSDSSGQLMNASTDETDYVCSDAYVSLADKPQTDLIYEDMSCQNNVDIKISDVNPLPNLPPKPMKKLNREMRASTLPVMSDKPTPPPRVRRLSSAVERLPEQEVLPMTVYCKNMVKNQGSSLLRQINILGAYMIRTHEDREDALSVLVKINQQQDDTKHYKIFHPNNKFYLTSSKTFSTLLNLIRYYYDNSLPHCDVKLSKPI